ncbi:glutaredoxin-like protein C5orf63 homolog isoform X4 [Aquarana catesbeiana]|uniref:glutaredoxin-like protein C5orf63 homolog isoform X4 n=1 Tax=Aquarana catesbeiana TaxID=8400 RepID=UPI003CC92A97
MDMHPRTQTVCIQVHSSIPTQKMFHLRQWYKDPCPLCDEAKETLTPFMERFVLEQVDITLPENSIWYDRYKYDIPVFHLNGQFLMMHRVNLKKLEKSLSKLELQNREN